LSSKVAIVHLLRISSPTFFVYFSAALPASSLPPFLPLAHRSRTDFSSAPPAQLFVPRFFFQSLIITMPSKYSSKDRAKWREAQAARMAVELAQGSTSAAAAASEQPEVRDFCFHFAFYHSFCESFRSRDPTSSRATGRAGGGHCTFDDDRVFISPITQLPHEDGQD
jgi:hypothetical protein